MTVDLFNLDEVMKDVRDGVLSSWKVFKMFGGIVDNNFVNRTNASAT